MKIQQQVAATVGGGCSAAELHMCKLPPSMRNQIGLALVVAVSQMIGVYTSK